MKKSEYHHGNLKEDLLKIAFDYIAEHDVDSLTLKVLADATGTSRSAIYRHFKSKDDLMEYIIERGFDSFDDYASPILLDKSKPLEERFHEGSRAYITWAKQNPNLYRLLFGKKYKDLRENIIDIKDDDCSGFGSIKLAIQEGQQSGLVKHEDSYKQTIIIWASLHGLASLVIDGFMDVEEISDELVDRMFASLLAGVATNKAKIFSSLGF